LWRPRRRRWTQTLSTLFSPKDAHATNTFSALGPIYLDNGYQIVCH
jgi:hypothetical protein